MSRDLEGTSEAIQEELGPGCKDKIGKRHDLSGVLKDLKYKVVVLFTHARTPYLKVRGESN